MNGVEQKRLDEELCAAVKDDNVNRIEELRKAGADVNYHTGGVYGPVINCAIAFKNLKSTETLLKHGANINKERSITPLYYAVITKNLDAVKLLLKYGADINVESYMGDTALQRSVTENNIDITECIVTHIIALEDAGKYVNEEDLKLKNKIRFSSNYKPLIDALPKLGYNGDNTCDSIKTFLEKNKDKFKVYFGVKKHTLVDFVDFEVVQIRHTPTLQLHAAISIVNSNLDKLKTEQHQANQVMSKLDKLKTALHLAWPCTIL